MRFTSSLLLLLAASGACNRVEEPQSSPGPQSTGAKSNAARPAASPAPHGTATAASTSGGRCLAEAPKEPPPVATPAKACPKDPTGPLELPRGTVSFPEAPGTPRVRVEIAREDAARTRGLMYRTQMGADEGMIFSWDDERVRSFWMRNTCLPLDMLFIARDGTIVGILEQVPTLNLAARQVPCPASHVLELNAGWARSHGVTVGSKVSIEG